MTDTLIAIIHKPGSWSSRLTKWATGSTAMHIGFVSGGHFYDMNLLFRRRRWPRYDGHIVVLYRCPVPVSKADLEEEMDTSEDWYGFMDYCLFALRKLMPWRKTWPSYKGAICSEKVEQILIKHGWQSPFKATPSPADFEKVLERV